MRTKKKDRITGTSKNEILTGFKGKDVLKGGGGADGFLFDKPIGFGKKQMDKILDFDSEELELRRIEIAKEWDEIEQYLQANEFWYLVNPTYEYNKTIELEF